MKKSPRLTPIELARLLLEMAGSPEVRSDFEVVSAEALPDGTLTRVVVRHLLHGPQVPPVNDDPRGSDGIEVRSPAMISVRPNGKGTV